MTTAESRTGALLRRQWLGHVVDLTELERTLGRDLHAGLRAQLELTDAQTEAGDPIAAWKIGLTSGRNRDLMGQNFRPFGHIVKSRVFETGADIEIAGERRVELEPELALLIGETITGPVSAVHARHCVASVHAAFEINEFRLKSDATHPLILADGLANWGMVLGTGAPPSDTPEATSVRVSRNDAEPSVETVSMDSPYVSLARLANLLGEFGRSVEAGQAVITGSFSHHRVVGDADTWKADFVSLPGSVAARLRLSAAG